jgi:hypothetical protein
MGFTVCVLLYGDYPDLAARVLTSLKPVLEVTEYRIGLNAVSPETQRIAEDWAGGQAASRPVLFFQDKANRNIAKYPLMRQMLHLNPSSDDVMWFDDDSHLDADAGDEWWTRVAQYWKSSKATQIGLLHSIKQRGRQYAVISRLPWYGGKLVDSGHKFRFATGGWWVADRQFLARHDYPFPALFHNGGDSILGELLRQQGASLVSATEFARCHCEACQRHPAKKEFRGVHVNVGGRKGRRGIGTVGERYVWSDGIMSPDLTHQNFELTVTTRS